MKRWMKILCIILALLVALLAGLYWWQRENLKAVKDAASHSSEELEEKLAENQQKIRDVVDAAPEIVVREVTEEERQALRDGTMTQEELIERLLDPGEQSDSTVTPGMEEASPGEDPKAPAETPTVPVEQPKSAEDPYQKELSAIIAKVYVLREDFTMALDNMYDEAKAEYIALPAEKRTKSNLMVLASKYLSKATALEKECDARMDEIVAEMGKLIQENNGDMSLVDTVVYSYANEKSLKKSWFMSKIQEKGLV